MQSTHLKSLLKLAFTVALFAWLIHTIDIGQAMERIGALTGATVALAAVLGGAQIGLLVCRWRIGLRACGHSISGRDATGNVMIGLFFNQLLVSSIGGDAVRVAHLARLGMRLRDAIAVTLSDRLSALLALAIVITATVPFFFLEGAHHPALITAGWGLVPLAAGAMIGWALIILVRRVPLAARLGALGDRAQHVLTTLRHLIADWRVAARVLSLATISHLLMSLTAWLFATGGGIGLSFPHALMLLPPVTLLTTLPISFGGWGLREGALVVALGFVGVPKADAVAIGVSLGLWGLGQGLVGGAWWLVGEGREMLTRPPVIDDLAAREEMAPAARDGLE